MVDYAELLGCGFGRRNRGLCKVSCGACSGEGAVLVSCKNVGGESGRLLCNRIYCGSCGTECSLPPRTALFLKTGLCGGFTTFSTFAIETETLFRNGRAGLALLYVALSIAAGVGLAFAGQLAAGK